MCAKLKSSHNFVFEKTVTGAWTLLLQREEEGTQFTADCRDKNSSMQSKGQRKISHLNKGEIQMKNEMQGKFSLQAVARQVAFLKAEVRRSMKNCLGNLKTIIHTSSKIQTETSRITQHSWLIMPKSCADYASVYLLLIRRTIIENQHRHGRSNATRARDQRAA